MKKYLTKQIVNIAEGEIGLDERQASRRMHNLKKKKKGIYLVTSPVQFKAGEIIDLVNPDKILLSKLEDIEKRSGKKVPETITEEEAGSENDTGGTNQQ